VGKAEGVANDRSIHKQIASYSAQVPGHEACKAIQQTWTQSWSQRNRTIA